ncbi:DNA-binding transcriptional regulator, AcrR family [Sinosporangium album]|uniref:DNA-binding transcriptional regulator, AcrR family n=1 Tax=Sinosporangium album TaxID=504805 RepID=A0A1G8F6B2_9ACTN|nr:DNA-binding transcriptional regulator, AcrR family [Sinosporangium album]
MDAAEHLLADRGSQALTLAAVAERAGCSKGGLLYHFSSKESLVKGMIQRLIDEFDELIAAQDDDSYSKKYVAATFAAVRQGRLRRWAVAVGAAGDPSLLAPLRRAMARWIHEGLADEPDPMAAEIVRLACEGVWEVATHAPELYDGPRQDRLEKRLMAMLGDRAKEREG